MSGLAQRLRASLDAHPLEGIAGYIPDDVPFDVTRLAPAAVLIPVIDAPQPRVLLTQRRDNLRQHAGQVAFPGGRVDADDSGSVAAALREAWEEVGLSPDLVEVVGTTRPYATHSNFLITPVIGVIPDGLQLVPHEFEVAALFEVPLDHLFAGANHLTRIVGSATNQRYYEIDWPDYRIWGITAGMIVDLAPRLAGLWAHHA